MTASDGVQHITPSPSDLSTVLLNVECTYSGCGRIFRNSAARQFHLEKVHKIRSEKANVVFSAVWYHCPVRLCPYHVDASAASAKHFTTKGRLKQHWLKIHAARVLACNDCSQSFSCQRLLSAHLRSCGLDLRCSLCCSSFGSIEALQSHCRRLGHSPHEQSLVLIKERLASLARNREESSSTAVKTSQNVWNAKAAQGEQQSISILCQSSPIVDDCTSSTEESLSPLSVIMVDGAGDDSPRAQPAFGNVTTKQPRQKPSTAFPASSTRKKSIRAGWITGENHLPRDDNESCNCSYSKAVTLNNKSIVSLRSSFREAESSCRALRRTESTALSVPVSIRSQGMSNQPHLLAAIALSELAASAIKRLPSVDVATQTECGRAWTSNKSTRRSCMPPAKRRVLRSHQSTETQTRLTTKSSKCKWRTHCSPAGARKKLLKRTIDHCPMHSVESQTKRMSHENSATLPKDLNDESAGVFHLNDGEIDHDSGRTDVSSRNMNPDQPSDYFVIDSLPAQKSISLGVHLPEVSLFNSGSYNSCSTQTSPRARVSVGMVTGSSFYDNITLTFIDECASSEDQAASQGELIDSQFTNKALMKSKPRQSSDWSSGVSLSSGMNEPKDSVAVHPEEELTHSEKGSLLLEDAVQNERTHLTPEVFKYSEEYLIGGKEEVLLEDHNFGDINYGAVLKQTDRVDATCQLSNVQLSNIETQTEHDVLLGHSSSPSNQYNETTEHELEKFGSEDTSTWCSIETQTCEDFSTIEQYLCSTTQTQTSDQVRRELFPELSISHSQTQTVIDDLPSLVHSHTQTYS